MDQWDQQGLSSRGRFRLTGNSSTDECIERFPSLNTRVSLFKASLLKTPEFEKGGKGFFLRVKTCIN